jgi:signal transduction histidine kinase
MSSIVNERLPTHEEMLAHTVRAARLKVAFEGHPTALALGTTLATLTLAVLWRDGQKLALCVWYGVFLAVTAARLWLFLAHHKQASTATPAELARLQRKFVVACGAAGASWGLACVLAFPTTPLLKMFIAFVMAGVSATAVASLSSIRIAAMSFVIAATLPLAVRLLNGLNPPEIAMSAMVLLFVILVGASAARMDAQLLALVRSRMEADEHLRARTAQREELQALNDRLRLAIQAGKAGIFEIDLTDNMIDCDAQLHQMYAIDAVGARFHYSLWRQRLHPQDLARVEASIAAMVEARKPFNEEFRVVWSDGTERVIKAAALVQYDATGSARRIIGMNSDITELKRVDRLKSEFVSIVSHELRTPLTSIRAALGLIASDRAGSIGDKARDLLQLANRNAERLGMLVDDMLDMERIESGKLRFELAPQALRPILEQSVAVNAPYATTRKIALRLNADVVDAIVAVDANRLLQVMTNLLSNAVKFSLPGTTVDIRIASLWKSRHDRRS